MELKFRTLNANEIECRVGNTIKDKETKLVKGFTLLLYKTARVDAMILDETVYPENWQKKFYQVKNTMICSLGIMTPNGWVWKDDAGDDDFQQEQIKGEASDSFKRAGFAWGIGRELYFAPKITIWINSGNKETDRYSVKTIEYDTKRNIIKLVIINEYSGEVAYSYPETKKVAQTSEKPQANANSNLKTSKGSISPKHKALIEAKLLSFTEEQKKQFFNWLDEKYDTMSIDLLSEQQGERVCKSWKLI